MKPKARLLRPDQVASRLNCSKSQAYALIAAGHFVALRIGDGPRGGLRITEKSFYEYLDRKIALYELEIGILRPDVP